jgi:hypothetical protein
VRDQAEDVMGALQASIRRPGAQSNDDDHADARADGRSQRQPSHQRTPHLGVMAQHGRIDPVRDAAEVIRQPHVLCGEKDDVAGNLRNVDLGACVVIDSDAIQGAIGIEIPCNGPLIVADQRDARVRRVEPTRARLAP